MPAVSSPDFVPVIDVRVRDELRVRPLPLPVIVEQPAIGVEIARF